MADTGTQGPGLSGTLRLTWVTDHLAHVIDATTAGETSGTWTGRACPDYGLPIGSDVDNATLLRLADDEFADLVWEASADFTGEHAQLCGAAIQSYQSGNLEQADQLWQQLTALWSQAWSASYAALELMQDAGLTCFSPVKPQRWVVASFEHHTSSHGLSRPHIHNVVIPARTAPVRS